MKIVFAGTPDFAEHILSALIQAGHEVTAVLCQPDRPKGRGQKAVFGPVKATALAHSIPVLQPESLRSVEVQDALKALNADLWVVVAYGALIPEVLLRATPLGCINIHASLLPRWRGAAPIQRAILAGDQETGISIMQMEAGLDTGPVLMMERVALQGTETTGSLHDTLAALGAKMILETLRDLPRWMQQAMKQGSEGVTYAHKIQKDEARLLWTVPALNLSRVVRAFTPSPGAWFMWGPDRIRVGEAHWSHETVTELPGTVVCLDPWISVATGAGCLHLKRLQRAGGRMLTASEFLRGTALKQGDRFD
jgi:methionyl-tRNA formyltransferase